MRVNIKWKSPRSWYPRFKPTLLKTIRTRATRHKENTPIINYVCSLAHTTISIWDNTISPRNVLACSCMFIDVDLYRMHHCTWSKSAVYIYVMYVTCQSFNTSPNAITICDNTDRPVCAGSVVCAYWCWPISHAWLRVWQVGCLDWHKNDS